MAYEQDSGHADLLFKNFYVKHLFLLSKCTIVRFVTFKLRCWRRLLRVPWTARTSNQTSLKEINPEYSLEGLMLKLKVQYFVHLI